MLSQWIPWCSLLVLQFDGLSTHRQELNSSSQLTKDSDTKSFIFEV